MKAAHFALYDDALPALEELRGRGLKLGLLSNSARDLDEFVAHHGLVADAVLTSYSHGKTKPHESIFWALLELLGVEPGEAVMVGRHDRGRLRGCACDRDAGGPARSRRSLSSDPGAGSRI